MKKISALSLGALSAATMGNAMAPTPAMAKDVVIYGCSPAGITAALEARNKHKSVALICRDKHVGGMTTNGLGWADTGNHGAIGGIAKQFYRDIRVYYADRGIAQARSQTNLRADDDQAMYVFEPHVAEAVFEQWLRKAGIVPIRSAPLLRNGHGVTKRGNRIISLTTNDGRIFSGRTFIDASYEGDLMAEAGISFTTGRESNKVYGETFNGIQNTRTIHHQFDKPVDPFRVSGDRRSGLLPRIEADPAKPDGTGDNRIQAYTYRLCMTKVTANKAPFHKPTNYDPQQYELLGRYLDAGWRDLFAKYDPIPNNKTDTNNHGAFSMDDIGMNYGYPTGSDAERAAIAIEHRTYQQGLLWFLQNDPRAPADVRAAMRPWGLCKDEFQDNGNWPHEMYIREARRMKSEFVMTERHLRGELISPRTIGLGSYAMDSHNVRRFVDARGHARNEGDIQVNLENDYPISYDAVVPKRVEADNLMVPVALSASHIAYGSIRMEPVFMILGQSAAAAAVLAIDKNIAVQDVPYSELRTMLLKEGQILKGRNTSLEHYLQFFTRKRLAAGAIALGLSLVAVGWLTLRRASRQRDYPVL
jgi:hypothetical protein